MPGRDARCRYFPTTGREAPDNDCRLCTAFAPQQQDGQHLPAQALSPARVAPRRLLRQARRDRGRLPEEGAFGLRRGAVEDEQVAGQGRRRAVHDRDHRHRHAGAPHSGVGRSTTRRSTSSDGFGPSRTPRRGHRVRRSPIRPVRKGSPCSWRDALYARGGASIPGFGGPPGRGAEVCRRACPRVR